MPDTACTIRYATITDAPAISKIYVETTRIAYRDILPAALLDTRPLHHFVPFWSAKLALPATKEQRILVAEREGSVVGFVAIGAASETSKVADDTGELHYIFVASHAHGSGIGRQLLTRATQLLHEDGYRQAILWVFSKNLQARRFYELAGWRTDGVERPDPALPFLEHPPYEVCYVLKLRETS